MAKWLRAAEELFEVVDRKAKHVVREHVDDLVPAQSSGAPAFKESREKSSLGTLPSQTLRQQRSFEHVSSAVEESAVGSADSHIDASSISPELPITDKRHINLTERQNNSITNGIQMQNQPNNSVDKDQNEKQDVYDSHDVYQEGNGDAKSSTEHITCKFSIDGGIVVVNLLAENGEVIEEVKAESAAKSQPVVKKLEDQLDEARGLLQHAKVTGKSKEARLAKVCAGLSSRLQELKAENGQLEHFLQIERESSTASKHQMTQLQQELASARSATHILQSEMASALIAKNAELEVLSGSLEKFRLQAETSEARLVAIKAEIDAMAKIRDVTEASTIQTLREELAVAERRAEEEHAAHNATRMAAVSRETELEQRVHDATTAMIRTQRAADERFQKAVELEQKISVLEIECATLNQELQAADSRLLREQKRQAAEDATQNAQAWREEAERARTSQREAEAKMAMLEVECQKLRVELTSTKRESDLEAKQADVELERRFRELTEILYLKQTQLEKMASEKAAALLQLEKESERLREAQGEVERTRRQFSALGEEDNGLNPFEVNAQQRKIFSPSLQPMFGSSIQNAAKFLDSSAILAGRFLWRRPLARIFVLLYLVSVHLFLMYLLHHLQDRVMSISSKEAMEAAAAAGLLRTRR